MMIATARMAKSDHSALPVRIFPGLKWWNSEYCCDHAASRHSDPRISRK
jgi:hypothetical protein